MKSENAIRESIHKWVTFFITALVLSGLTSFTLETELAWLDHFFSKWTSTFSFWINKVYLALKDPLKNKWIIQFGGIACCLIFPLAFIAGYVREFPFYWQVTDCSFGVIGLIPLTLVYNKIEKLETIIHPNHTV